MDLLQDIHVFFNALRLNGGALWVEKGKLRFSAPQQFQSAETDDFIRGNKTAIVALLEENAIASKAAFAATPVLRDSSRTHNPLSPAQERLWFIEQYEQGTHAYHMPTVYELEEGMDRAALRYALQQVVARHEVLRSTIEQDETLGYALQHVQDAPLNITEHSVKNEETLKAVLRKEISRPFDLSKEYPLRAAFYTIEEAPPRHFLFINTHHIAGDGWSLELFQKELLQYYEAYCREDAGFSLPPLEVQYRDYAHWQRTYLGGETLQQQLGYWKEKLNGFQTLEFPADYPRPGKVDYKGAHEGFALSLQTSRLLRAMARDNGVTLNSVLQAGIAVLLGKYTGQEDIVTGSVTANRQYRQTKELIGFFINAQACRTLLDRKQSFTALVRQVHESQVEAQQYQDMPFEKLVDSLGVERDPSRHPVFQVMYTMESFERSAKAGNDREYLKPYVVEDSFGIEKFDLSIFINDGNEALEGEFRYATSLFSKETIRRLVRHFTHLMDRLCAAPGAPYADISLLSPEERHQVVNEWNAAHRPFSTAVTLPQLFSIQAAKTPHHTALTCKDASLSYAGLDSKSNRLARHIRDQYLLQTGHELAPGTFIALYMDRSPEMVIALIAVLKAGGAYVPVDPSYPQERVEYMLADTQAALIISQQHLAAGHSYLPPGKIICADPGSGCYASDDAPLPAYSAVMDAAYVIYTSGTTGKPKGVVVEHRQVTAFAMENNFIDYHKANVVAGVSNYAFDGSIFDLFFSLLNGKQLALIDQDSVLDPLKLDEELRRCKADTVFMTTALFNALVNEQAQCLGQLKQLLFGGERCNIDAVNKFKARYPGTMLLHVYGPTENIVYSTCCRLNEYPTTAVAPIGAGLADKKLYVLDAALMPVPPGVAGELYIGGAGVARGYLNRADLTAERFLPDPFATEADKAAGYTRMYKTGDLVKWLPGGLIEYIGRNDDQVKIRGFRIELGEIEHALLGIEGVKEACVLAKDRGAGSSKYLVAYYAGGTADTAGIRAALTALLPEYMVPGIFVRIPSLPLTVNGKVDRRALPEPEPAAPAADHAAPVTPTEKVVCNIWQSVLGLHTVSIHDHFFRIGGDSILSIQVASRIRQAGLSCQVKDIFEYKTIAKLAEHLDKHKTTSLIKTEQGPLSGEAALLPIQQWFLQQAGKGNIAVPNHYNHSFLVRVPALDTQLLEKVMATLLEYHDLLRAQYIRGDQSWKQLYRAQAAAPELKVLDVRMHTAEERERILTDWQSGFDIEKGALFSIGYLHGYPDGSARICLALHHLIVDTVSWRILIEDLQLLYAGKQLPAKGSSYRQWTDSVAKYPEQYPAEAAYWKEQLSALPAYRAEEIRQTAEIASFELSSAQTRSLLQEAAAAYHTEVNDLLLTALAYALKDVNHSDVQGITLEGHGREDIDASIDHSHTLGWFTTMFPLSLAVKGSIRESICFNKEQLRSIPNKGLGFGAFALKADAGFTYDDLPPVSFNYLGQFDSSEGEWQVAAESSGKNMHAANVDHNLIGISGMVTDGCLGFSISSRLGKAVAQQLSERFRLHLQMVIDHCLEKIKTNGSSFTPSDFPALRLSQSLISRLEEEAARAGNAIVQIYPASSLQQGFIYHVLSYPQDDAYRVQVLFDYHEPLDIKKYIKAWELCMAQYPGLRTAFGWEEGMIQVVYKQAAVDYRLHDISDLHTQQERDAAIEAIRIADRQEGFDLRRPGLLRLHIIRQGESSYTVLKNVHHIIIDGWSESLLLSSVHRYYHALKHNRAVTAKEDTAFFSIREYIGRQQEVSQQFWKAALAEAEEANDINALLSRPLDPGRYKQVQHSAEVSTRIVGSRYEAIKAFSRREGITMNVIVQFAWHKLLQVYSGRLQSIVGTTVSGRDLPVEGIAESVGLYINTLPLILHWDNSDTILAQLQYIQRKVTELNSNSFAELAKLQKNGERLFHSLFVYENFPAPEEDGEEALDMQVRDTAEKGNYPLGFTVYEQGAELVIRLTFDAAYLDRDKAMQHLGRICGSIGYIAEHAGQPQHSMHLLTPEEYDRIIYQWNETDKAYAAMQQSPAAFFRSQAVQTPGAPALLFEGKEISYAELDAQSGRVAEYLHTTYALGPNDRVAVMLNRSDKLLIALLGILKAGAAYVCIDPRYRQERKKYILDDAAPKALITETDQLFDLDFYAGSIFAIDVQLEDSMPVQPAPVAVSPDDLAYVLYTSGTTGKPKGVMITQRAVMNYVQNVDELWLPEIRNVDFSTNIAFDLTVTTTICALLLGKKVVIYPGELRDTEAYVRHLVRHQVDFIKGTPSLLASLPAELFAGHKIKQAFAGGEKLENAQAAHIRSYTEELVDEYGPTEATVGTTFIVKRSASDNGIGRPYRNYKVYVLDATRQPVPPGVAGELYIGGAGLAAGYLNLKALTAERFIPNPFATEADRKNGYTKLYKTGDLVRWLADGSLEYIGRNDDQLKIRGYRIEPAEIEQALLQLPGISQACVIAKERRGEVAGKYLAAYYVGEPANAMTDTAIRDALKLRLPEYMIPAAFTAMDALPLTFNGKLDKRALPDPDFSTAALYSAPANEMEMLLCGIWQELLGLEQVSTTDDFFRIGGDSILSIQVSNRLRQEGINCQVKDVFECKTVAALARQLGTHALHTAASTEQGLLQGELPLLPIQQWFVLKAEAGELPQYNHWNHSFLVRVPPLEPQLLAAAVQQLAEQHDMLRVRFDQDWKQVYLPQVALPVLLQQDVGTCSGDALHQLLTSWQNDFDLQKGPVFRAGYLHGYADGSARIFFAAHHLLMDAVSWRIVCDDLKALCEGKKPAEKGSSYRQWSHAVNSYAQQHADEAAYWKRQLEELPAYPAPGGNDAFADFTLDRELTRTLLQEASQAYHTEINDLLLTAFAYALKAMNGSDVQGITMEGHGREAIDPAIDHSRTLGWFTTLFPFRLELQENMEESIRHIKESLRELPNKGIGFGSFAVSDATDYGYAELPPVSFNYLGQFDTQPNGYWQLAAEDSGNSVHPDNTDRNAISAIGRISKGQLEFTLISKSGEAFTQQLAAHFKAALAEVISHCRERLETVGSDFTPSDLPDFIPYEIRNEALDEDPVFIFPPGSGGAYSYYTNIVPGLGNRKIVLFNNYYTHRHFAGISNKGYTLEKLGRYYSRLVRRLQPRGSYTFLGWSFGGVLALETLRQLPQEGESHLVALDSWFSQHEAAKGMPVPYLEAFRHNINYSYRPEHSLQQLNITLFKATRRQVITEEFSEPEAIRWCEEYYMNTGYNGLDLIFAKDMQRFADKLQVIRLDCDHNDMLETQGALISRHLLEIRGRTSLKKELLELDNNEQ